MKQEKVRDFNFQNEIKWFENGKLNISYNCLDRHVESVMVKPQSYGRAMIHQKISISLIINF